MRRRLVSQPGARALGKFSKPLYRDRPFGALARNDSPLRSGMRGDEALALAGEALLVKDGYSYGPQLDRLIAQRTPPAPLKTSVETLQMLRMLLAGRAGWMIVAPEESQVLREEAGRGRQRACAAWPSPTCRPARRATCTATGPCPTPGWRASTRRWRRRPR